MPEPDGGEKAYVLLVCRACGQVWGQRRVTPPPSPASDPDATPALIAPKIGDSEPPHPASQGKRRPSSATTYSIKPKKP